MIELKVRIRKIRKKEVKDVPELIMEEIYDDLPAPLFKAMKKVLGESSKPPYQWFVAEDEKGEILGLIAWLVEDIFPEPPEVVWEISWIVVYENSRLQGIGKKLIKDSLIEVKQFLPDVKTTITVSADDENAMQFYRATLKPFLESKEPRGIRFWADANI